MLAQLWPWHRDGSMSCCLATAASEVARYPSGGEGLSAAHSACFSWGGGRRKQWWQSLLRLRAFRAADRLDQQRPDPSLHGFTASAGERVPSAPTLRNADLSSTASAPLRCSGVLAFSVSVARPASPRRRFRFRLRSTDFNSLERRT